MKTLLTLIAAPFVMLTFLLLGFLDVVVLGKGQPDELTDD